MPDPISVLVVEDEALIRLDITDYLDRQGFRVFAAAHAAEAIEILEREPAISIMFTDIQMPGSMDGLRLAAAVRDRWPPIKIVVTSGHMQVDPSELPDGGMFFAKPYQQEELATTFRELAAGA
jgi:two-component system, response regulator PdtaR